MTDLLPCPFCGEQCGEWVINQGDKWGHVEPSCLEVRTAYNTAEDAPWRHLAAVAWNTRATPQPTRTVLPGFAQARADDDAGPFVSAGGGDYDAE